MFVIDSENMHAEDLIKTVNSVLNDFTLVVNDQNKTKKGFCN
jgi:hypothetical protein